MKNYPLEIEECLDDCRIVVGYYSKGHHEKQAFLDKLDYDYDPAFNAMPPERREEILKEFRVFDLDINYVSHRYARLVPNGEDNSLTFCFTDKPGKGATPYTWYDLEQQHIDRAYESVKAAQNN